MKEHKKMTTIAFIMGGAYLVGYALVLYTLYKKAPYAKETSRGLREHGWEVE